MKKKRKKNSEFALYACNINTENEMEKKNVTENVMDKKK